MSILPKLVKLTRIGERQIAQRTTEHGIIELVAEKFVMEDTSQQNVDIAHLNYRNLPLLMPDSNDYSTVREAHKETGISERTLRKWCEENKITAQKDKDGKWWILKESLRRYIEETRDD